MVRRVLRAAVVAALVLPAAGVRAQAAPFVRGDANADGAVDIGDAMCLLCCLSGNARVCGRCLPDLAACEDALDANDDGRIDISDAIKVLSHLFAGTGPLPAPFGPCGADPTADSLACAAFPACDDQTCPVLMLPGGVPLEMVWCPAGTFLMGRYAGEQDSRVYDDWQHQVTLTRGFCLGKYEVTKRQWQAVMGTAPWAGQMYVLDDPESPAVYVSWNDAQAFIAAVNVLGQGTFGLPTEAQWEYACRAGMTTRFYWGDDPQYTAIGDYAWYDGNALNIGEQYAHVVGQKLPNAWGLYDMSGNVWEWCQDWWAYPYPPAAVTDPAGPATGSYRVFRGGSWFYYPWFCRSAYRSRFAPWDRFSLLGFRLARTSPP